MTFSLCLAFDASLEIGLGHCYRCLAIAKSAILKNIKVDLLVGGDLDLVRPLAESFPITMQQGAKSIAADVLLCDLTHPGNFKNSAFLEDILAHWKNNGSTVALFDSLGEAALRSRISRDLFDVAFIPYVYDKNELISSKDLVGPQYFVIDNSYQCPPRLIRKQANYILVTCGGTDPKGVSLLALAALAQIPKPLKVKLALGPGFSKSLQAAIKDVVAIYPHSVELLRAPKSLAKAMLWCDCAIAMTGLTKYELAATGTPALLVSLDQHHALVHKPFERLGTSIHVGEVQQVSEVGLANKIIDLTADYSLRLAMSQAGQSIIDGRGVERILGALGNLLDAA